MEDQSKLTFKQMLSALLRSNRRHARYIQAFACLAVLVAVAVPLVMRQYGVAMTTTETRLACQYAGNGAHTHNADCYDAYGNLVCPLPEKPFHTHTDSCYATERVLTCALPETAGHAHTDACYDEDGNLTCTIPEEPAHTHTDACYETRTTDQLTCGMEETTEEHVHGPACFETVTVELPDPEPELTTTTPAGPEATVPSTPEEDPTPAQEFTDVLKKKDQDGNEYVYLAVQVKAPQGALPKGSTMTVAHVDLQKKDDLTGLTAQEKLDEVLRKEAGDEAAFVQADAVDITFKDAQGNRIDPAKKVEVRITTANIRVFSDQRTANDEAVANNSLLVLHVVDHQQTKRTDAPNAELIRKAYLVNQDEKDTSTGHEDTIVFEAQEFSPYVVACVDNAALAPEPEPEPEPEAQPAETEQPAAEATLDLTTEDQPAEAEPERPAQSFTHRFTDTNGQALLRVDVLAPEGAFPLGTTMQVKWVDVSHIEESVTQAVSERTDGKLRDMRAVDITFIDADGHEIEPAKKITVTFASDLIDTQDDAYVVHVDDEGKSEVIDALGSKELEKREMPDQADELVFESDAFSTYVVAVTTLHKELAASDGATYDITVDAPAEAGIPQDAELRVSEIVEGDEGYDEYLAQAVETAGLSSAEETSYARFFDIEIWSGDQKIEPSGDVQVSIKLMDTTDEEANLRVVHFSADGPEMMELLSEGATDQATAELTFATSEFSVYSVVNVTDDTALNGQSFALVTGIAGDPGATTGYGETWGRDYFTIIVNAHAVSNTVNGSGVSSTGVHAWQDGSNSYVGGEVPMWTFESAGNGKYYLSVIDGGGNKKYLTRNGDYDWDAHLSNQPNKYSQYVVKPQGDGTALIYYDGGNSSQHYYLYNDGGGEWATRTYKFRNTGYDTSNAAYRFRLCTEASGFEPAAAQKVAASSITTNANYIIYRKFVDEHGNEALYALAHDGSFVRVYDGGDTVYYRETDKNIYWNYQMDGSYPVLFTQDPTTHETIYINPNHTSGQTLSTTAGGLTLIGKDNGEYGTAIERWDQTAYDYAGLHVTVGNDGAASLSTGTRVAGTSDEFLFAVARAMPGATAETVATVDSDSLGIKITMFDYGDANTEYSAGTKLDSMTNIAGSADYTPHAAHALVKPYLESGVPSSTSKGAMTGLFSSGGAITYSQANVNRLFLQSYYDESGTFRYRSEDNYAYLGRNGQTDFTVYRQAATPYTSNIQVGHTYYHHGHFMPYNDIDMNNNLSRLMNQYGNAYENGNIVGDLPVEDGRTYEDIYGVQGIPNFYTGMKMEANFMQPKGGKLDNGDDMIFKFTGDDDMWVYIDGVLVLDVGGIHEPLSGTINFATGKVTNPTGSSLAGEKTLYQIFQSALNSIPNDNAHRELREKVASIQWKDVDGDGTPDTFADYTSHSFGAFYMERGAGASNLDIQFNLKVVLTNQFAVEKAISDDVDPRFDNQRYKFKATYKDAQGNEHPLYAGINGVCSSVVYRDRKDAQGNPVSVNVDENGFFYLQAGEAAIFKMEDDALQYDVKEVDIDDSLIEKVEINGEEVTVTDREADAGYARVGERTQVVTKNFPKKQNLLITKYLTKDSAPLDEGENPVFEFRVYLETTVIADDGTETHRLVPYSYGPYYLVKEVEGNLHYFTLTGTNNAPVDKGTDPVVCSTTGRSGSINSIPPEYTIIIPNLVVGTNFYVEERRDNIPSPFEFAYEDLQEGTYDPTNLGSTDDIIHRVIARDETDHQAFDPRTVGMIKNGKDAESHVYNRKPRPTVPLDVEKTWGLNGQGEAPANAEVTVELQYRKREYGSTDDSAWTEYADVKGAAGFDSSVETTLTLKADTDETKSWKGSFKDLPTVIVIEGTSYDVQYTAKETKVVVGGVDVTKQYKSTVTKTEPTDATASAGKVTVNNDKETIQITVEKAWDPEPTDPNASVTVELHRMAKKSKGTFTVTLTDQNGAAVPGAGFTLYKDGEAFKTNLTTDVNGMVTETGLEPGTYYYEQTSIPEGYELPDGAADPQKTSSFTVLDNITTRQEMNAELSNKRLKTAGQVTLTVLDNKDAAVQGAEFTLYKGSEPVEGKASLLTNTEGKIVIDDLDPGTYYFVQTNTPDDYHMPQETSTASFTVEENLPGQEQKFDVSMTNTLKGKGTISIALTKGSDSSAISGATFELWKDDAKVAEGTTDTNGQLTFGSPTKLEAGNYTVKQTSTDAELQLAADQTVAIDDNGDNAQEKSLAFTNESQSLGTATITLKRSDNNAPISGAKFELWKDGLKVAEGTTDTNGQLTFGAPTKLSAGTYTVKQASTDDGLGVAADQNFTIADNHDSNQSFTLNFTNEEATGNNTVIVYAGQGGYPGQFNNRSEEIRLTDLKAGATVKLTVNLSENGEYGWACTNFNPSDNTGTWTQATATPITLTFTIPAGSDNQTFCFAAASQWGVFNRNIVVLEEISSRAVNAPSNSPLRTLAKAPVSLAATAFGAAVEEPEATTRGPQKAAPAITDAQPVKVPEAVVADYMEDSAFQKKTYTITSADADWKYTFAPEDKCDPDGNPYYYYVVETEHTPDTYWIESYTDPLSDTGTITVTNKQKPGGLTITKAVTVNGGAVPSTDNTIADGVYTFTITGPEYPEGHSETITVAEGVATNSIVLENIAAGEYTISETGSTNPNGITLAADQNVTVAAGSQASANTAAFTNNLETTQLTVNKVWSDGADKHTTDEITYTLYRIPHAGEIEFDPEVVTSAAGYSGKLNNGNSWTETITNLPKNGTHAPAEGEGDPVAVTYSYYVSENAFEGYRPITTGGESGGTYSYTITNTPNGSFDTETELDIEKLWNKADGTEDADKHIRESITVKVTQKKYYASNSFGELSSRFIWPVRINLIDGNGETSELSRVVYLPTGVILHLVPNTSNHGHKVAVSGMNSGSNGSKTTGTDLQLSSSSGGKEVTLKLENHNDKWVQTASGSNWTLSVTANYLFTESELPEQIKTDAPPVSTTTFEYTMSYDGEKTTLTPLADSQGAGGDFDSIWSGSITDLPSFTIEKNPNTALNDTYLYLYEITEVKIGPDPVVETQAENFNGETSHYFVKWINADGTWTITNQKKPTVDIELLKADSTTIGEGKEIKLLAGATFYLTKKDDQQHEASYKPTVVARVHGETVTVDEGGNHNFTVPEHGVKITGLESGTYVLHEVSAPDGYNVTTDGWTFTVDVDDLDTPIKNAEGTAASDVVSGLTLTIPNPPGAELPEAGGPGTLLHTLCGLALFAAAGYVGLASKRSARKEVA